MGMFHLESACGRQHVEIISIALYERALRNSGIINYLCNPSFSFKIAFSDILLTAVRTIIGRG